MSAELELLTLFSVSFLAATILPAQSEILLAAYYKAGQSPALLLLLAATIGNVLGSCANWLIGRFLRQLQGKKWFKIDEKSLDRATHVYQKYGVWSLLFAWVPFIGDPLTIVAGILRANLPLFILLVTTGKVARYIIVLYALGFSF